jgi:hypothetical protein
MMEERPLTQVARGEEANDSVPARPLVASRWLREEAVDERLLLPE